MCNNSVLSAYLSRFRFDESCDEECHAMGNAINPPTETERIIHAPFLVYTPINIRHNKRKMKLAAFSLAFSDEVAVRFCRAIVIRVEYQRPRPRIRTFEIHPSRCLLFCF